MAVNPFVATDILSLARVTRPWSVFLTNTLAKIMRALLRRANAHNASAKTPQQVQQVGNGDCAGCDCGFFFSTPAEIGVITSPIGKGSMKVIAAFRNGSPYSSLYFGSC